MCKIFPKDSYPLPKGAQRFSGLRDGLFIPFDSNQPSIGFGSFQNLEGMPSSTQGGIHINPMGSTSQQGDHLFEQNRDVSRSHEPPFSLYRPKPVSVSLI